MVGCLLEGWHAWKGHNVLRAWQSAWHLVDTQERLPVRRVGLAGAGRQWVEDTIYATPNVTVSYFPMNRLQSLVFFFLLASLNIYTFNARSEIIKFLVKKLIDLIICIFKITHLNILI